MLKKIKKIILYSALFFIILSSWRNSIKQVVILTEAKKENNTLKKELDKTKKENKILEKKIKYASSSAFIKAEIRDKFGLGSKDDYWLVLPNIDCSELQPKVYIDKKTTNWQKWWKLFKCGKIDC